MNVFQPFRLKFSAWADWTALFFMALVAPLIAALIQSLWVFRNEHWIYQAVIGGAYFHAVEKPGLATIGSILVSCGIFGVITFPVLKPFRKRALYRWLAWLGSIVFWTWMYFVTEITIK